MEPGTRTFKEARRQGQKTAVRRGLSPRKGLENSVQKAQGPRQAVELQTALKGRWKKRVGRGTVAWSCPRKLQECTSKGVGEMDQVKRANCSLKDCGWGFLQFQEYQRSARYSAVTSSVSEMFTPSKMETYLIAIDGWGA